ncbi:uncharacterized protein Dvir_GJ19293 [Drosophila virilis]|uniref:Uncharacterized protein n=2 Tax=Drosophila virilis TaxID=7244 RepID=B4MH83_DROVI|nr:uncharacterized protein Dvir_GJ19293 [Drosophila virilis]
MSGQTRKQPLLLFISFACIAATFGQRLPLPREQLLAPTLPFAESFEILDGNPADAAAAADDADDDDGDSTQRTREQLRQVLGQQLTGAVAPLTATPLAVLSRRQPAVVAPRSGAEAAQRFADSADEEESSEEDSDETENESDTDTDTNSDTDTDTETDTDAAQEPQQEYNPYRDNFNDRNEDGSYVFGYALPNGVRRWERGFYSEQQQHGLVVEGFYVQPRNYGHTVQYELRCYRADAHGYHPLAVEYLRQSPSVRRDELPNVRCLKFNR